MAQKKDVLKLILIASLVLLIYIIISNLTTKQIEEKEQTIEKPIVNIITNSEIIDVFVEIADNSVERIKGLMFRKSLDKNSGMLFVFRDEQIRSFWMKNTLIPLDMIFIDKNFIIADIKENAVPCKKYPCQKYISKNPAQYVLEVNTGFVKNHNIKMGDKVKIE